MIKKKLLKKKFNKFKSKFYEKKFNKNKNLIKTKM